jgi:hypothetical protein
MLLLGLLAAMMLVASPVLAWQPAPNEGNKYSKNYYPNTYFKYCDKNSSQFYGKTKASKRCAQYYTGQCLESCGFGFSASSRASMVR